MIEQPKWKGLQIERQRIDNLLSAMQSGFVFKGKFWARPPDTDWKIHTVAIFISDGELEAVAEEVHPLIFKQAKEVLENAYALAKKDRAYLMRFTSGQEMIVQLEKFYDEE